MEKFSLDVRDSYERDYYLLDCGGFEDFIKHGGRFLTEPRLQSIAALASIAPRRRVLDLGCGRGELTYYFASRGSEVTAIDYSESAVELARACCARGLQGRVDILCADAASYPYEGEYDLVLAGDLVEHMHQRELAALYRRVATHLAPKGIFVVHTFPNRWYYQYGYARKRRIAAALGEELPVEPRSRYELMMHINEHSPRDLRRQLLAAFPCVVVWGGTPEDPAMGLRRPFGHRDWREVSDLYAIASHEPVDLETAVRACQMAPLTCHEPSRSLGDLLRLYDVHAPETVHCGSVFDVRLDVENHLGQPVNCYPPHPVHLSYHWLDAAGGRMVDFEGLRSKFVSVQPGETCACLMKVRAPSIPGEFRLSVTLVQEGIRWLDSEGVVCHKNVEVVA